MTAVLSAAAAAEALMGLALLVNPGGVSQLLFGEEPAGAGVMAARVAGISLIALGAACWSGRPEESPITHRRALRGMLTYGVLVTLYLGFVAVSGKLVGPLLWPAIVLHLALTILLARGFFSHGHPSTP